MVWKECGMKIELLHVPDCPHVDAARALLSECLTELQLEVPVADKEGAYPSPTILINGIDVMGAPALMAAACRLDIPTKARLLVALRSI
jgi:hypothetical protein